jgi:hypothetical protein
MDIERSGRSFYKKESKGDIAALEQVAIAAGRRKMPDRSLRQDGAVFGIVLMVTLRQGRLQH